MSIKEDFSNSNTNDVSTSTSYMKTITKNLSEFSELRNIFSTYILTQGIQLPYSNLIQINLDTFIKLIFNPTKAIGNILILQGGVKHMNKDSYYVKTTSMFLSQNIRLFIFEKFHPVINYKFSNDVSESIQYIRKNFSGPIIVVGYSMGGMLLLSYLATGHDDADMYLPACCSFDFNGFKNNIESNKLFSWLQSKDFDSFGVQNYDELLELAGTNYEEQQTFMDNSLSYLNENIEKWINKTIYIVSEMDPLTKNYKTEIGKLHRKLLTYEIKGGWHCCLDTSHLITNLSYDYCIKYNNNKTIAPKMSDINCKFQY